MKTVWKGMLVALALLGTTSHGFAMAEYNSEDIVFNKRGCWKAEDSNYVASGRAPGNVYLVVRMTPLPADAERGGLTASGHLNQVPNFYVEPQGGDAGEYKGMTKTGAAAFYVPREVNFTINYVDKAGNTYEGYMEVCLLRP